MVQTRRQRTGNNDSTDGQAYSGHAQQDAVLAQGRLSSDGAATNQRGLTLLGKVAIFLAFPLCMGLLGLYMAFLKTRRNPAKQLSIDQDFIMPFLLAMAMAVVVGFQTGGFKRNEVKPLVPWPKVRRVKKVVHKKSQQEGGEIDMVDKKEN